MLNLKLRRVAACGSVFLSVAFALTSIIVSKANEATPVERGQQNLTHNAYGFPLLSNKLFAELPKVWEPEWRARINPSDPDSVRQLAFERYGLSEAPWDNHGAPLQYVGTPAGEDRVAWTQACMLCHGGRVPITGESKIGMPNTELDMQTIYDDIAAAGKFRMPFALKFGMSRGRTNAFVFSLELLRRRELDLTFRLSPVPMGEYQDYDLDAPPWWYLKKKTKLYADGLVTGDFTRSLMQFTMGEPSGAKIRGWENDFKDILAYLKTIEAPKYPLPIDAELAVTGAQVFKQTCAGCHGTYGENVAYPNKTIPIEIVGTDAVRLHSLNKEFRAYYKKSWFGQATSEVEGEAKGYVAPPLDGVWASAPYFHNGSVPTVYGVLTEAARPRYFRRVGTIKDYNVKDLGLKVETLNAPAAQDASGEARRRVINTTLPGLSNQGHPFGFKLSEKEKRQVIEYLKTL